MGERYSHLKALCFPEKLDDLKRNAITAPVHIRLKPTNRCNHRCWYCGYQNDAAITLGQDMDPRQEIPHDKMVEIATDLVEMGVRAVTFSGGGEPLLYPHIEEFVERLLEGGIKVACLTNGSLLSGQRAALLAGRASWVRVSMDGWDDESYRIIRRVKSGEFTKICRNLEEFALRKGHTVLGVSLNVDEHNQAHVVSFLETMSKLGVDHVKVAGCVVANDGAANNAYHAPFFHAVNQSIIEAREDLERADFRIVNAYHEMPDRFAKAYSSCPFLTYLTIIAADLNVYTCQDKAYTAAGRLGSIRERSFRDFWFSEENRSAIFAVNPSQICGHHCVTDRKNRLLLDYLNLDGDHVDFV